jgi:uncharacterized lipoprotein YddW (UPF0748 family)
MRLTRIAALLLVTVLVADCAPKARKADNNNPDALAPSRPEFRAAWVATVANIDWPSRPGLPTEQQLAEIGQILNKAAELKLNAIILQVRCAGDAFYGSPTEPWSEYLTGRQGQPPAPYYDPLATWVAEAHRRGIELHAWFNPFRVRQVGAKSPAASNHVSALQPQWVRTFEPYQWLDPGDADAQRYVHSVVLDVVRRYDVDGVHIDDYFYPYPEYLKGADFPDEPTWQKYRAGGGPLGRNDWRRDNVNRFVRDLYANVKREKPRVQVGISPFGIWRPNNPPGTTGLDPYEKLYADSRLWLTEGWCDYFVPQLYWARDAKGHAYGDLLNWWVAQNPKGKQIYAGNKAYGIGTGPKDWPATEIIEQIRVTRKTPGAGGNVFFSMKTLVQNRQGIADLLKAGPYAQPSQRR